IILYIPVTTVPIYYISRTTFQYSIYSCLTSFLFFFNDPATTEIYTLSLHDALPIFLPIQRLLWRLRSALADCKAFGTISKRLARSEEHTSELQSRGHLVCRLLLEKKKKNNTNATNHT